jgi:Ca2+-binding RTX toxin-like protein
VPSGTIVGGENVIFSLNPGEIPTARDALAALSQGFTTGRVIHHPGTAPTPGDLNVYNFTGGKPPFKLPTDAQGVVLIGNTPQKITGHSGTEALIGNQGPDTIVAGGGHGTIIAGDGANLIKAGVGPFQILTGAGRDTVNLTGGADTFTALGGHDAIHLKGTQLTATGTVNIIGKVPIRSPYLGTPVQIR